MGARVQVELPEEQSATLKMWANSGKTEQRMATRAKVILLAAEGLSLQQIAARVGLNCLKKLGQIDGCGHTQERKIQKIKTSII